MTSRRTATLNASGTGTHQPLKAVRVRVVDGPDRGREARLEEGTLLVGTHDDCNLVLTDSTVSRRHAQLELLERKVRVRDLGSKNGMVYLGARAQLIDVPVGASVDFGSTRVAFLPDEVSDKVASERTELQGLLGQSLAMRRLFAAIEQAAPTDVPVLIRGETGTGKELVANALHSLSERADGPFRVFDCASVERELLPSALFGHVRGAFTDAKTDAKGAIGGAHRGTLFLDEIGELPLDLQRMLLRSIETGQFTPVGGNALQRSDFRVLAATHRDLAKRAETGEFRQDLYYRLAAVELRVPPLRDRVEDLPVLVEHFARAAGGTLELKPATLSALAAHRWPGNVRELRNVVMRSLMLKDSELLNPLAEPPDEPPRGLREARDQAIAAFEKNYLIALLERHDGSVSAAAKEAGVTRSYIYRLMETHDVGKRRKS